jgi:hypothetical protein
MKSFAWILILMLGLGTEGWSKAPVAQIKNDSHRFSGLKLKGQYKKPDLTYIYKRKRIRAEQILNIPENFNDEIVRGSQKF